jgi:hypothetical protein
MKSLKPRFVLMCLATILTLGLSYVAAQARCADIEVGGSVYGDYDCRLIASCYGWCYYHCTCKNLNFGADCDKVLLEAGYELAESDPVC